MVVSLDRKLAVQRDLWVDLTAAMMVFQTVWKLVASKVDSMADKRADLKEMMMVGWWDSLVERMVVTRGFELVD